MSVIVSGTGRSSNQLLVKGAAESVVARCSHVLLPSGTVVPIEAAHTAAITAATADMASSALRCLAIATKSLKGTDLSTYDGSAKHKGHAQLQDISRYTAIESGLTFVGLAGLQDPPRPEVRSAIGDCSLAGIRVIVITGAPPLCFLLSSAPLRAWPCTFHVGILPDLLTVERGRTARTCALERQSQLCTWSAVNFCLSQSAAHKTACSPDVDAGDNQRTAEAICKAIGVFPDDGSDLSSVSMTGRAFSELPLIRQVRPLSLQPHAELEQAAEHRRHASRVTPLPTPLPTLIRHSYMCACSGKCSA